MRRTHWLGALVSALALVATMLGTASPAAAANTFQGNVEEIVSPAPGQVRVAGWMFDDDVPTVSISYHVYIGGGPGDPNAIGFNMGPAAIQRDDVARNYPHAGPFHGFGGTMDVPLRGNQPVYVYAINGGGPADVNQLMRVDNVFIQNPLPDTTITSGPPATSTNATVTFGFGATEPSSFTCRWDQGAWTPCTSPLSATVGVGSHTFSVYATDYEGAPDPSPASYAFTVAAPPPPPPPAPPQVTDPPPPTIIALAAGGPEEVEGADRHRPRPRPVELPLPRPATPQQEVAHGASYADARCAGRLDHRPAARHLPRGRATPARHGRSAGRGQVEALAGSVRLRPRNSAMTSPSVGSSARTVTS